MSDSNLEIKQALLELTLNIRHMDNKQDQMADDIRSIREAIYNPETGIYARIRTLEQWQSSMSKIIWSVGLGCTGLILKTLFELIQPGG